MAKSHTLTERQIADKLDEVRLDRRLSFRELGEEIGRAVSQSPIPEPTVRKFIQRAGDVGFHETTVHAFRKYVAGLTEEQPAAAAR